MKHKCPNGGKPCFCTGACRGRETEAVEWPEVTEKTFEERMREVGTHHGLSNLIEHDDAIAIAREADTLKAALKTAEFELGQCVESVPVEAVERIEDLEKQVGRTCRWEYNKTHYGWWTAECENSGPRERYFVFCPYCGGRIVG